MSRLRLGAPVAQFALAAAAATGIPGWFIAGSVWIALGAVVLVAGVAFGALMILEGILYYHQQAPITPYIRSWTSGHLVAALAICILILVGGAMALTHFVFDVPRPQP